MKFELTQHSIDRAKKELRDVQGRAVMIGNVHLSGVVSANIAASEMYDGDPDPSTGYDGGRRDMVDITFNFGSGQASISFCPDTDICHFWEETDDLICFEIQDIPEYVEKTKFDLDFRLQEYEKFMNK